MEGVLSEGVLSEGVLSGGGFVRAPYDICALNGVMLVEGPDYAQLSELHLQ